METKIPPPIVTLVFGLSIYFSRGIFQVVEIKYSFYFGILLLLLGFVILISAVRLFRKDKTTVNPLSPEQATKLVTDGIFKYSRIITSSYFKCHIFNTCTKSYINLITIFIGCCTSYIIFIQYIGFQFESKYHRSQVSTKKIIWIQIS